MKAYTSIEQSRKLAEILPVKSADMYYHGDWSSHPDFTKRCSVTNQPCWSLAALLNVLPDYTLQTNSNGTVFVVCDSKKPMISDAYDNPVDACVEMVVKLYESKLL